MSPNKSYPRATILAKLCASQIMCFERHARRYQVWTSNLYDE